MSFPSLTIAASGGRLTWGTLEVCWANTIPEGCQLTGNAQWGYVTLSWRSFGWYFGV